MGKVGKGGDVAPVLIPVRGAAGLLNVSMRRVRYLIAGGRLQAVLSDSGRWQVVYPFQLRLGTRGPRLGQKPVLAGHEESRTERLGVRRFRPGKTGSRAE